MALISSFLKNDVVEHVNTRMRQLFGGYIYPVITQQAHQKGAYT